MDESRQAAIRTFRAADRSLYPELAGYTSGQIYEDTIGGGALYLAARINPPDGPPAGPDRARHGLRPRHDLGVSCTKFRRARVAVDLWTPIDSAYRKITEYGLRDRITPLHLDVRQPLPFPAGYFDAVSA